MCWLWVEKVLNLMARLPFFRTMFATSFFSPWRNRVSLKAVLCLPDRRYMEKKIFPALRDSGVKHMLFVGCGPYTAHYPALFEKS